MIFVNSLKRRLTAFVNHFSRRLTGVDKVIITICLYNLIFVSINLYVKLTKVDVLSSNNRPLKGRLVDKLDKFLIDLWVLEA